MPAIRLNSYEEVWALACQKSAELMELSVGEMDWDAIAGSANMSISDFVEKRLVGLEDYLVGLSRRLAVARRRLEHVVPERDSPRKEAAEIFVEHYKEIFEQHLDNKAEAQAFVEANNMLYDRQYIIPDEVKREIRERNSQNALKIDQMSEEIQIYDQLFASFFRSRAIPDRAPTDQLEIQAEERVFARLAQVFPQGEEYEPFKRREGYVNQQALVMEPAFATMVIEPNEVIGVTMENFQEKLASPKKADREWGYGTFDKMMEGIYTDDELRGIRDSQKSLLDTVFVDGKNVRQWLPKGEAESEKDYEARAKCQVVACALAGKGKIDICPLRKEGEEYNMGDPVSMQVKVNLEEEIPVWKRALRFFHIKSETKKEKAERISIEDLGKEERQEAVRRQVRRRPADTSWQDFETIEKRDINTADRRVRMREQKGDMEELRQEERREQRRQVMEAAVTKEIQFQHEDDQAYFGFLKEGGSDIGQRIADAVRFEENGTEMHTMDTLPRQVSRRSIVRLYAMTRGMSLEQVVSDDPALNERKAEIGREFIEKITMMSEREYAAAQNPGTGYEQYRDNKKEELFQMARDMCQALTDLPYELPKDLEPETLAAVYEQAAFMRSASKDFEQSFKMVEELHKEEMDEMIEKVRPLGELRHMINYCDFLASDSYVRPDIMQQTDFSTVCKGFIGKESLKRFITDTSSCKTYGELSEIISEQWLLKNAAFETGATERLVVDSQLYKDVADNLITGKNPVCFFDQQAREYVVGSPREISQRMMAAEAGHEGKVPVGLDELKEERKPLKKAAFEKKRLEKEIVKEESHKNIRKR